MIAGEASADAHGAHVVRALAALRPDAQVFGIGGPALRQAGMEVLYGAEQLGAAGLTEVLGALPRLVSIFYGMVRAARARRPDVAVLIDMPDFNLPLAKRLRALGIPVVYYISPQVWAWRPARVKQIRRVVNRMLVILPFEQAFYQNHQVVAEFVGHPLVEHLEPERIAREGATMRAQLGVGTAQLVALLPGSRRKEVSRHLPIMLQAVARLRSRGHPTLRAVLPIAPTLAPELVARLVARAGVPVTLLMGQSQAALGACDAAMVCSGTATLETALIGRPMVVVYRLSALSYFILRRLVTVSHVGLVNLIAGTKLAPELLQGGLTAEKLAEAIRPLLEPGAPRQQLMDRLRALRAQLGQRRASLAVAQAIGELLPGAPRAEDL